MRQAFEMPVNEPPPLQPQKFFALFRVMQRSPHMKRSDAQRIIGELPPQFLVGAAVAMAHKGKGLVDERVTLV